MARSGFNQHAAAYGGQPGASSNTDAYLPSAHLDAAAAGANSHRTPHNDLPANQYTLASAHVSHAHAHADPYAYAFKYTHGDTAWSVPYGQRHALPIPVY